MHHYAHNAIELCNPTLKDSPPNDNSNQKEVEATTQSLPEATILVLKLSGQDGAKAFVCELQTDPPENAFFG